MNGSHWVALIAIAATLVLGFRFIAKRRAVGGRTPRELIELHRSIAEKVGFETFEQVYRAIGDAYSVDPRLIRSDDSLKKLLDMDSWVLDAGTEKLNERLRALGVEEEEQRISTVLDLLLLVEAAKTRSAVLRTSS